MEVGCVLTMCNGQRVSEFPKLQLSWGPLLRSVLCGYSDKVAKCRRRNGSSNTISIDGCRRNGHPLAAVKPLYVANSPDSSLKMAGKHPDASGHATAQL